MANDDEWVQDVKRWYLAGTTRTISESEGSGDDDVAITVIHRPLSRCDCGIIADRSRGARSHLELS